MDILQPPRWSNPPSLPFPPFLSFTYTHRFSLSLSLSLFDPLSHIDGPSLFAEKSVLSSLFSLSSSPLPPCVCALPYCVIARHFHTLPSASRDGLQTKDICQEGSATTIIYPLPSPPFPSFSLFLFSQILRSERQALPHHLDISRTSFSFSLFLSLSPPLSLFVCVCVCVCVCILSPNSDRGV